MPIQVSATMNANYKKFVEFAKTKNEDTVARSSGMPSGDYKGIFANRARARRK